jgi:hypothetical protein
MKHAILFTSLILSISFLQGCAVQKELVPTGGSRADGIVKLSYEYGLFEAPQLNAQQGVNAAKQRCSSWGYKNAEAFGGSTKSCIMPTNNGCNRWLVSIEYQCTEYTLNTATQISPPTAAQPSNPAVTAPSLAGKASERMTYIKELKDKGLLSQDEYEVKRKEILKDL